MTVRGHLAAIRFGLGLRLGEAPPADPESWLAGQLARPVAIPSGPSSGDALRADREAQQARVAFRQSMAANPTEMRPPPQSPVQAMVRDQSTTWVEHRLRTAEPFVDRLVDFWANHFTVSRRHAGVGALADTLEREAIRPHLHARFEDMLVAVTRHPAMLRYLDNVRSVGPNSASGQRGRRGLNETLAREVLELHTLSPAGGYTQGDVQELARILTGWSVSNEGETPGFVWQPEAHEPGPKALLGRRFVEGEGSQEAALRMLATHPATARHVAAKLARHFVADDPPPAAVAALEETFRRTEGDLGAVHRRLVTLPEAWEPPLAKFRQPRDYVLAVARAAGFERASQVAAGMATLDQALWFARQPNGWPDRLADWAGPEALMRRADWAYTLAGRLERLDVRAVAAAALGPLARAETVGAMRGAGSVRDALTLLFVSPEFMFR